MWSTALPSSSMIEPALRASALATDSMVSAGEPASTPRGCSQRLAGQQRVRAGELFVGDEDAPVRPHGQAFADRIPGALGSHRHEHDLAAMRLFELQAFFDAALVAGVQDDLLVACERVVR